MSKPKVIVVMPAYQAEKTLRQTYEDIPSGIAEQVLVVDDASTDNTVRVARELGLEVICHAQNRGYGGNQKTCYQAALERNADLVVMLHPDHQYDPKMIPALIAPILAGKADAVFGSRMLGKKFREGGMPLWKFQGNIILTALANLMLVTYFTEFHSGFRAYSRTFLERVHYRANSDNFVFDTQIILQGLAAGLTFEEIPIATRYFDDASQIGWWASCRYALEILIALIQFRLFQAKLVSPKFLNSP
jgi:glycosyltransferase involved in cell wall biosynthesis